MKRAFAILAIMLPAVSALAQSTTWTIDPAHTQAGFQAKHLSITTIRGSISNVTGTIVWDPTDPSKDSVTATLDVNTINTANDYRDKFIKGTDFFNAAKYPRMTFRSTTVYRSGDGYKVDGNLTIGGITKLVSLDVDDPATPRKGMQGETVSGLSATTSIKRADFNFGTKYPDAVVSDIVKITIDLEMTQK